jgi:hypothetical protein
MPPGVHHADHKVRIAAVRAARSEFGMAQAQNWPDRPVRFISSQAAGNGIDITARFVADQLSGRIGQPVIVENRPSRRQRGSVTSAGAHSAADGHNSWDLLAGRFDGGTRRLPVADRCLPHAKSVHARHHRVALFNRGE